MTTPDDALNWHRHRYPCSADIKLIRFVEDEGYELEIGEDEGEGRGWEGGTGDEGRPKPEALTKERWRRRAPSTDDPVSSHLVTDRWIYAARLEGDFLRFRFEIHADGDGRLRWIDDARYHDLRADSDIEDLDDSAYMERWTAEGSEAESAWGPDGTEFSPPVALCHQSIPWYFFAMPVRLPTEAVDTLMGNRELLGPSPGFVHGARPLVDSPMHPYGSVSVVEARVIDPLVEVRRCTESYHRRQDRYIEYLTPLPESQRAEQVQARKLTLRIANASVRLVENNDDISAADVVAPAEPSWEEIKAMCFTDEELELVGPDLIHPGNGALNFVAAERKVRSILRREASQTATALRIWLASRCWAFVEKWILERASHNPEAAVWLSIALSEATRRLHELPTGARYTSWLTNRAIDPDYHDDPNVDVVRMFAFPEIDRVATLSDFKTYAKLPRAAFNIYLWANRRLLSRRAETIAGYMQLAFGDDAKVLNPTIRHAMNKYVMSNERRIFYRGLDRFEDGLRRIAGRPILDCIAVPTQGKVIVYPSSGDFGQQVALGTTLRVSEADDLADGLLQWEAEHADWERSNSRWFAEKFSKLKVAHVGTGLALLDLFVNARELHIALTDDNKTCYDKTKAATMLFSSIYSIVEIGKAAHKATGVVDPAVEALQAKAVKMPAIRVEDFRSVRKLFGKMASKVSPGAVASVLSVIAMGFAAHDAYVAYDEKTEEEYYAAVGALIASAAGVTSTILGLLSLARAGQMAALIAVVVGLAMLIYSLWLPGDAEIAVRTSLFGTEYQRRRAEFDYDHSARPWQACANNSPMWFVPSRRFPHMDGLVTQVLALTNLMSNFTVALHSLEHGDLRGLKIILQPGFVSRDACFELEVEMEWFLRADDHDESVHGLDTWRTTYRFSMFPEPWAIPVDHALRDGWEQDDRLDDIDDSQRAEFRRVFHSAVLYSGGPLEIVRPDPTGCVMELTPSDGAGTTHNGDMVAHVDRINLHEAYRVEAQVVGTGADRQLRIFVILANAPGWSASVLFARLRYSVDQDGPFAMEAQVEPSLESDSGVTFEVPLPEDQGDLMPETFRIQLVYDVSLPDQDASPKDVTLEGEPAPLGAAHDVWLSEPSGRPLELRVPFHCRISHDGRGLVVELGHDVVNCKDLASGKEVDVDLPISGVLMQYIRNEDRHPPQYYDGYGVGAGLWLEPKGEGVFHLPSSSNPAGFEPERIRLGDRLRFRFVFELGEADQSAQLYPSSDLGPELVPHGHGDAGDDLAAADRWILGKAKVKVRLVSDDTHAMMAMPSNSRDERILWLEQEFQTLWKDDGTEGILWFKGEPFHDKPPGEPKAAISACLPPTASDP